MCKESSVVDKRMDIMPIRHECNNTYTGKLELRFKPRKRAKSEVTKLIYTNFL
jgi:hypothetical protein